MNLTNKTIVILSLIAANEQKYLITKPIFIKNYLEIIDKINEFLQKRLSINDFLEFESLFDEYNCRFLDKIGGIINDLECINIDFKQLPHLKDINF